MADKTTTTEDIQIQVHFIAAQKEKSELDICWTNMIGSDMIHNFDIFSAALTAWCRLNPTHTLQDLETELRKRNLNTHIIAVENTGKHASKDTKAKYYPRISCRPSKKALEELLTYQQSYEHNYRKLKKVGSAMMKRDDPRLNTEDFTQLHENSLWYFIADCKIEMKLVTCT